MINLLIESNFGDGIQSLTEAVENGEKKYFIEGIFAQANLKNRNGRIYSKSIMEKAVKDFMPTVESRRALGELNHPPTPQVNPERASHLIEKLEWKGDNVMGRAKILTSLPMGKIAKGLIDEGVSFGVSTRGTGSVTESKDGILVGSDFSLKTIDLVSDPSGIDCWVAGIMENQQWVFDISANSWVVAENTQKKIKQLNTKELLEQKTELFFKFLNQL